MYPIILLVILFNFITIIFTIIFYFLYFLNKENGPFGSILEMVLFLGMK